MKNLLLWGWFEPDLEFVVEKLARHPSIKIVDRIGDTSLIEKSYLKFLYNPADFGSFVLPRHDAALTEFELVKFLHMFSREARSRGIDFHEQLNIAKSYFRYFLWLLTIKKVDHVLFSMAPIIGCDYLCYLAAKRLNIKVTMCYQSLFPNRFFYCHTLEDFGSFTEVRELPTEEVPKIDWGYKKDLFYMKKNLRRVPNKNPWYIWLRQTLRHGIRTSSKPMKYSGVIQNFIQAVDFSKLYDSHAKSEAQIDLSSKYIYFPLHLQPELTTTGFGGCYSDQLDAIERLSEMAPAGWKIFVKENPKQNYDQRGAEFFRRILSIANVEYISKDVDTYLLLEHCQFLATVTGTAGWEAITGGKPCLVFGLAWYAHIQGAIQYQPSLTVDQILATPIQQQTQERAFATLYRKMRQGVMDSAYIRICPNYSRENNAAEIVKFVEEMVFNN